MQAEVEALPREFVRRLKTILPPVDAEAALRAMSSPRRTSFRVNTLLADSEGVVSELASIGLHLERFQWKPDAFHIAPSQRDALLSSDVYTGNSIYVQSASSMIPVEVLAPEPGEAVLDLAAAPGSKTLQIVCHMENRGEVAAVEVVRERFYKMNALLKAQGAEIVRTFLKNGMSVWRHRPDHFDRVLLDAPCSSEGRFDTRVPETFAYWSPRKIREMERKQRKLLYSAVRSLRPGGVMVYSTCSFAPEENEGVLTDILDQFSGRLEPESLEIDVPAMRPALREWEGREFDPRLSQHARRLIPDGVYEGFFVAKLRRTG